MERLSSVGDLERLKESLISSKDPSIVRVRICMTGCRAFGAAEVRDAFKKAIEEEGLIDRVVIVETGCHGFCAKAPVVAIDPFGFFYQQVSPKDVNAIVNTTLKEGRPYEKCLYRDIETDRPIVNEKDVPFYRDQMKVVLRNCGYIDPTNINEYIERDGYMALAKVLTSMSPEEVIEEITESGLRGRGGAGFSTGKKWQFTKDAPGETKYIICNADEGDPGAFMDRAILEGDPHSIIEGMLIAAYAIGAQEGYLYVRAEYPIAVVHIKKAVVDAMALGLLGDRILGTDFSFHIKIKEGAGAFVCGEETALIASIEGRRGMPRPRPPFPAVSGLWGKPTNINNVETYANVPNIILKGSEWFSGLGTEKSKGTKIFALAGKINNTGLVEVPMGVTLKQIIFDIGGGIPNNKRFKAAQTGGPSGGCIPESMIDLPIDYDSLTAAGAIMGSGGLVIMDENTCMVDLARYFLTFTQNESCGKCVPCRVGTKRMLETLENITNGNGRLEDIDTLKELAKTIKDASLCGLGQTAPNPVLTTVNYFLDEYKAHIEEKRCPAGVCKALIKYTIDPSVCTGCGLCKKSCPQKAISGETKLPHAIEPTLCIKCGICYNECKFKAINIV
ncbi:MAG: NADH-quinone oxidoreductase subunit NuoF [Syntrophorhabdaceae bacterium]|nr:NADH-quinone oxidoreductase subunit NuoF [Syntrophorhabdaceae bacterium]